MPSNRRLPSAPNVPRGTLVDFRPEADHYCGIEWHHDVSEGGARVAAALAEDVVDEVRGAVQHRRDLREVGRATDVALDADDLPHPLELARRMLQLRDPVQRAEARGRGALLGRELRAELPGVGALARAPGVLERGHQQVARNNHLYERY